MEQGLLTSQILRLWPADRQPPTPADLDGMAANCLAGNDALALAAIRRSNSRQMVTTEQLGAKGCRAYDAAGKPRISRASAAVAGRRS